MSLVTDILQSGWIAFAAIAVLWVEFAVLCLTARTPGARFRLLLPNVLAGTCLLAALGFALLGGHHTWVLLYLGLALVAHGWDVAIRLRSQAAVFRRRTEKLSKPAAVTQAR